jgi:hypothetical protein
VEADAWYRPGTVPAVVSDPINWMLEARVGLVVTVFTLLLGSVVGLVWHAVAPQVGVVAAVNGSAAATKPLIGDDLWLALIGVIAGVVCVLVLRLLAPHVADGPGALVGLAIGGFLGMLVAARVGHLIGHQDLADIVRTNFPKGGQRAVDLVLGYFDFTVRAKAVLFAWPIVSVLLSGIITWIRALNQPTPRAASPYPGFS